THGRERLGHASRGRPNVRLPGRATTSCHDRAARFECHRHRVWWLGGSPRHRATGLPRTKPGRAQKDPPDARVGPGQQGREKGEPVMATLQQWYPGDRAIECLLIVALGVTLISIAAWLAARSLSRRPAGRHLVLITSLLGCLALPVLVTA